MSKKDDSDRNKGGESTPAGGASPDRQDEPLPGDFEEKARQRFEKLTSPEINFEQHLENEKREFRRQRALERDAALRYQPTLGTMTPCGNGDFERTLDPAEWQGAHGLLPVSGPNPFAGFTAGLFPGTGINDFNSHQSWVDATATDPNVGIATTAQGSSGAVRIGNNIPHCGCELLSKTFVVTPASSTITFWYAVVMQNPFDHDVSVQPFFWVRVTDALGNIVPGAFDFGTGSDKLIADKNNPFFKTLGGGAIVYKDWSCAQINLSSQVGNQVTVEFVTADCGWCGHWGYAYVDSFCGDCKGSPTGNITYNGEASSHCGRGQLCFDYSLPTISDREGNPTTGSATITLDIYQNGNGTALTQLTSPTLTSGSSYCFDIKPLAIPGINQALGGFDFAATATFAIGNTQLGHIKVGSAPDGVTPGQNNDYNIACSCEEIEREQDAALSKQCAAKVNFLPRTDCDSQGGGAEERGDCNCDCVDIKLPDIKPCIAVAWGDSECDCFETDDVEVLCVTVCNCYSNVTFNDLSIGRIRVTDMQGNPVPVLPDGTPSVQVIPSGPICFGDIGPCRGKNQPGCVSRELVLYTRGARGGNYQLSFEGVCFSVSHHFESEQCFVVNLCQD